MRLAAKLNLPNAKGFRSSSKRIRAYPQQVDPRATGAVIENRADVYPHSRKAAGLRYFGIKHNDHVSSISVRQKIRSQEPRGRGRGDEKGDRAEHGCPGMRSEGSCRHGWQKRHKGQDARPDTSSSQDSHAQRGRILPTLFSAPLPGVLGNGKVALGIPSSFC